MDFMFKGVSLIGLLLGCGVELVKIFNVLDVIIGILLVVLMLRCRLFGTYNLEIFITSKMLG